MRPDNIPAELRAINRWLAWRAVPKAGGGIDKRPTHKWRDKPVNFDWACRRVETIKGPGGVGFWFSDDDDIGGVDLDCARDPKTGAIILDWAQRVLAAFGETYTEVSPSGTGVKLWAHGCPIEGKRIVEMPGVATGGHTRPQLEAFGSHFFFTVTGDIVPGAPNTLASAEQAMAGWKLVLEMLGTERPPPVEHSSDSSAGMLAAADLEYFLTGLDVAQHQSRPIWFSILCAAYHVTGGDVAAREVFVEWSAGNAKFAHRGKRVRDQWTPERRGHGVGTLIWHLRNAGRDDFADGLRLMADRHDEDVFLAEDQEFQTNRARLQLTDALVKGHH